MNRIVTSVRHRLRHDSERGAVSVYVVIIAAVLMLMAGLCIEGGRVLNARATPVSYTHLTLPTNREV